MLADRSSIAILLLCSMSKVHSFLVAPGRSSHRVQDSALAVSFPSAEDFSDEYHPNRKAEFIDLGPVKESATRQARMELDEQISGRFATYGDDLWSLRKVLEDLSSKLINAINQGTREKEEDIREQIRELEGQDPELVYRMELENMNQAQREGRKADSSRHGRLALDARSQLPHYNLDGLWVGKYGQHGYELINVTYVGDQLIAYKVTGDKNVPRGEITFQVNLDPVPPKLIGANDPSGDIALQPISLTDKAAKKWGTTQLPRYKGLGQVAEPGFSNSQWMDGQLIIIGEEYFSFAWVPIEQQIFFGRPSPELALKMLRETSSGAAMGTKQWEKPPSVDEDVSVLKQYVASCLERTSEDVEEELEGDPFSCIWHGADTEECYFQ